MHMATLLTLLQNLLCSDLFSFANNLVGLVTRFVAFVRGRRLQGIYEVLEQRRTVTLRDPQGRVATVDTTQRVRFRQNHVTALTEYAWGEGQLYADYRCTPGVPVDFYAEGSRQVVLISLREHKNAGEELTLHTHRRITNGFLRPVEYWESDINHRTRRIELRIVFPTARRCQRATVSVPSTGKSVALGPECYHTLPDGRQALCWTNTRPRLNERYLLRWEW
jgi:hypothetical protein